MIETIRKALDSCYTVEDEKTGHEIHMHDSELMDAAVAALNSLERALLDDDCMEQTK